jgi:hypothetical protein
VIRSIKYTSDNPAREGLRAQHWKFITPYVA